MEYQEPPRRSGMPTWAIALLSCGGCFIISIPILAAILFPVFAKARQAGVRATCLNNLKACGNGMAMYAADWNDQLPSSFHPANDEVFETATGFTVGISDSWASRVRKYRGNAAEFTCPSDPTGQVSYQYKHAINEAARQGLRIRDFGYPTRQMMLHEKSAFHFGGGPITDGAVIQATFVDGHVVTFRMTNVASDGEPRYFSSVAPTAPLAVQRTRPYVDPRYCYDVLP